MSFRMDADWVPGYGAVSDAPESRSDEATLAEIRIEVDGDCLTRLRDDAGRPREFFRASAYRLAEWISANWWRLGYEAERFEREEDRAWGQGHSVAGIGAGWLWPRITIATDGDVVVVRSAPTESDEVEPIAWRGAAKKRIPRREFFEGAQHFVHAVLDRLDGSREENTGLHTLWKELTAERSDPEVALYRQLEGSLGYEPDGAPSQIVERLHHDRERLGPQAMTEVAANGRSGAAPLTADALEQQAGISGFESDLGSPSLTADLAGDLGSAREPAWSYGERAAKRVRRKAGLGDGPLDNRSLADLCGSSPTGLAGRARSGPLAFGLDTNGQGRSVVLRSGWETGRRFELARLLGDALLFRNQERLHPATRSETFPQRAQRAFAMEFLAPYAAVSELLAGDTSPAAVERAAGHFHVSDQAVTTMLVNKKHLPRHRLPPAPA